VPGGRSPADREAGLARLARRFFSGHGPAELTDLCRWASLPVADARLGLDAVRGELATLAVEGRTLWYDPARPDPVAPQQRALLVPLYDELVLTYPGVTFPVAPGHLHPPGTDKFVGSVLVDETDVGRWRRTVGGRRVTVSTDCAPLTAPQTAAVTAAVPELAAFLQLELVQD